MLSFVDKSAFQIQTQMSLFQVFLETNPGGIQEESECLLCVLHGGRSRKRELDPERNPALDS